ncbi:MAG: DNA mismatch repair protein MutL, partial [Clostridium sp.]
LENQNEVTHKDILKEDSEELPKVSSFSTEKPIEYAKFPKLRVIGQFNKTYIIGEFNETLYLIDQHAAHEKIMFEKYMDDIKEGSVIAQPLLIPVLIDLSLDDFGIYEENKELFKTGGFNVENFGETTISLRQVPYIFGKLDIKNLFMSILDNLKNLGSGKTEEVKFHKIASMACKSAIKANDSLSKEEMEELLEKLRYIEEPFTCPHGRPTIIKMGLYELEKRFKRIQ